MYGRPIYADILEFVEQRISVTHNSRIAVMRVVLYVDSVFATNPCPTQRLQHTDHIFCNHRICHRHICFRLFLQLAYTAFPQKQGIPVFGISVRDAPGMPLPFGGKHTSHTTEPLYSHTPLCIVCLRSGVRTCKTHSLMHIVDRQDGIAPPHGSQLCCRCNSTVGNSDRPCHVLSSQGRHTVPMVSFNIRRPHSDDCFTCFRPEVSVQGSGRGHEDRLNRPFFPSARLEGICRHLLHDTVVRLYNAIPA